MDCFNLFFLLVNQVVLSPPTIGAGGVGNGITDKFTAVEGLAPDTGYTVRIIPVKGNDEGTAAVVFQRTGDTNLIQYILHVDIIR